MKKKNIARGIIASGVLLGSGIAIAQAVSVPEPPVQQSVQAPAPTEASTQQVPVNADSAQTENGTRENVRIAQADQGQDGQGRRGQRGQRQGQRGQGQRGQAQNMTPEQRQEQMQERLRERLEQNGLDDQAKQDAVFAYMEEDRKGGEAVRTATNNLRQAVNDEASTDDEIKKLVDAYHAAQKAEQNRQDAARKKLDSQVSYSTNPRLEGFLITMGVLGEGGQGFGGGFGGGMRGQRGQRGQGGGQWQGRQRGGQGQGQGNRRGRNRGDNQGDN